ncbi:MAG: 3'-5' exonuclease, partial [Desulfobacterales bacterium]|nr:3'-5' exonuclease [Desulfobacterales bacterium]
EAASQDGGAGKAFIGLGRSIYSVVGEDLIHHALDEMADKLAREEANVASYFVVVGKDANLLRAEAVPILNSKAEFSGFIIIFFDITEQISTDAQTAVVLQNLVTSFRASLASVRSTIELILEYPDIDPDKLRQLRKIILKETVEMGRLIDQAAGAPGSDIQTTRWPLAPMSAADIVASLGEKARERLDVLIDIRENEDESLIKVDSYSLTMSMLYVIKQLKAVTGQDRFGCEFESSGRLLSIDLSWRGDPVKIETLRQWDKRNVDVEKEGISLSLKQVMRRHEAEIWSYASDVSKGVSCLRLFLPVMRTSDEVDFRNIMVLPESRPEFYDFDLFNQPGQNPTLDNRLLTELTYTVFDTETTGLDPRGGDEIISIAAIRIVNGRLLREELFDQLIDPRRSLPPESTKIHGIRPEMLEGQPLIADVLPRFQHFTEDTILVAHNAAFDMRMLQMKEETTGVRFINPVLDTLLLSAVVNPIHKDHNIEGMAGRFGVNVVGRHTALGDAITTGELLLKLLPLLAEKGVTSLKQAREASKKTYYARLKY